MEILTFRLDEIWAISKESLKFRMRSKSKSPSGKTII